MTREENRDIIRRYTEECWNKKNLSMLSEFIAPDCPHHLNGPVNYKGPEGFKEAIENWFRAFPDTKNTIEDEISEGNKVVVRGTTTGTHTGELKFPAMPKAIPPTGKRIELSFASIAYMADGKIVENWDIRDVSWIWGLRQG